MQVANIYPNRITITHQRVSTYSERFDKYINSKYGIAAPKKDDTSTENLKKKKSSLNLSKNSIRELRNSVNSIIFLSKPRTVYTPSKKAIYNFRGSLVTLTLPSEQYTTDVELKKCLDLFLQDIRRAYKVKNYIWRSELQDNGNIHFHIVLDKYIYHKVIRNYWLKALRHTSYVSSYQKKFINMSFHDYKMLRLNDARMSSRPEAESHKLIVRAYAYGKRTKWLLPNCTDVKSIYNVNQMSAYVSKYLAKETRKLPEGAEYVPEYIPTEERIATFGKVWGRSTSLSRLKYKFPLVLESVEDFIAALKSSGSVFTKVYDYATVHYFNFKKMPDVLFQRIKRNIFNVALTWEYPLSFN